MVPTTIFTMLKPISPNQVPPGGWTVEIEGAGPPIKGTHISEFINAVRIRLESNDLDHHGWKDEILDLMCRQRPDIPCEDDEAPPSRAITIDDIRRFISTLIETKKAGAEPVSEEEQDRRAAICGACPNKGHVACFGGCGSLAEILSNLVIGAKGKPRPELHKMGCNSCGCELSSLILYPLDVLRKVDDKIGPPLIPYPAHCWKLDQPNIPPNPDGPSSAQPPPGGT